MQNRPCHSIFAVMALRILMVCIRNPWPPVDGGSLAMYNMMKGFHKAGHDVTAFSMNTPKHSINLRDMPEAVRLLGEFYSVDVDTEVSYIDLLASLTFSRTLSYQIERFNSRYFRTELREHLRLHRYDVIQFETLYMLPYLDTLSSHGGKPCVVAYRAHNVEHEIWERRANNEENPVKRYAFFATAERIKRYEQQVIGSGAFDALVPISSRDEGILRGLGAKGAVHTCPAGMDLDVVGAPGGEMEYPSVFYLGALDWQPNREGMDWFLKEVWPRVHAQFPNVKFYLAGRNMPDKYLNIHRQNIVPLGEVPDAGAFIRSKAVMVAPIFSGSGMRVKVVEGMAYGKAMVATPMATEGIGVTHGDNIFLADKPGDFAERIAVLIGRRNLYDTIGARAAEFIRKRFDNDQQVKNLLALYTQELAKKSG
ncbi:MAG: glycosyltransferase family 4 protein [Bacteroidia bacterium]